AAKLIIMPSRGGIEVHFHDRACHDALPIFRPFGVQRPTGVSPGWSPEGEAGMPFSNSESERVGVGQTEWKRVTRK
ncbi:MAG: hypothetical protein P8Y94_05365, partial [Acidobacteriota bacterium]